MRCALPLPGGGTCGRCLRRPPACQATVAALVYRFPVDALVVRFKHAQDFVAGRALARELALATQAAPRPDLLVVPPLGRARLRERGFNQALELARAVGNAHRIAVASDAVVRLRETARQEELGRRERLANLARAFAVERSLGGRHVGIVDDVMTTGATVEAIAIALRHAGAARVSAWIAARTPEPGR